jgi:multidrug efflux pump subunit AcrA (membrane-fusion protein)
MLNSKQPSFKPQVAVLIASFAAVGTMASVLLLSACGRGADSTASQDKKATANVSQTEPAVELSPSQLSAIKIQPVEGFVFSIEKRGIGSIDFDNKLYFDNTLSIQVFPPREGKIVSTLAELGDEVQKGDPLYSIATANETALTVRSPVTGQITSVNAVSGLLVQPGKAPAPYAVADVSIKWMTANVPETDSTAFHIGQAVNVTVMAYPGRTFEGKIVKIYPTIDANTHRVMIRSEVADPKNELRSGMLAEFITRLQDEKESTALPADGVVREADGTMTAWVTSDRHRFVQRIIKIGLREENRVQILEGLQLGELAVSEGAVFLSNMLNAPPSD